MNISAQSTLEKINIGERFIRIQTNVGNPIIDIELIENTDNCLTNCYAVLQIHPHQEITLPNNSDSEFAWTFKKEKSWMDDLVSYHFELLEQTEHVVEVPEYGKINVNGTCFDEENETYQCEIEQDVQTGSHEEITYIDEFVPFNFWGETLEANENYTLKIVGKKRLEFGKTNNIDWIPTIKGFELKEWEWWNASYGYRICQNNNATQNIATPFNGTDGFCGDIIWIRNATAPENICAYSTVSGICGGSIAFANDTGGKYWENESDSLNGNYDSSIYDPDTEQIFHFDNTTWVDSSGNGRTGSIEDSDPSITSDGILGNAIYVDGDDCLNSNYMAGLDVRDPYTICVWAKNTSAVDDDNMFGAAEQDSNVHDTIELKWQRTTNRLYFYRIGDGKAQYRYANDENITLDDWNHYCIVSDGGADTDMHLYLNGLEQSTALHADDGDFGADTVTRDMRIGCVKGTNTYRHWPGYLDEYKMISTNKSADWVLDEYMNGIADARNTTLEENSCPSDDTLINETTKFEAANLFCNLNDGGSSGVLIINASDIILDCNGMNLNGTGSGAGIFNDGFDNVTIKNCKISNYFIGISLNNIDSNVENNSLIDNKLFSNNMGAFFYDGVFKTIISGNNITGNEYGIYIDNYIGEGIEKNNTIINSSIISNEDYDVYITADAYDFFINTSYETEYVNNANLSRQWYLKVNVTNKSMVGIEDAEVSVHDKFNNLEWQENTTASGLTGWNIITQYNLNSSGKFNYTPHTISGLNPRYSDNSTIQNITDNEIVYLLLGDLNITFNVTSGEDGSELDNVNIICNYTDFNQSGDTTNLYGPFTFPYGIWWCKFSRENYYNKTVEFSTNNDKIVDVIMSSRDSLTIQEHTWLEAIYDCLINKDCDVYDLWNQTYEITSSIWDQFKQTDESVVISEVTTNSVVNETSNLTIEYLIDVPVKEDYQFLPIRIFYWFMDENNETCYNQAKDTGNAETPFCNPLVAQTIGEVNTQINFTVELRPDLPAGNYTIVRRIDIDPENVWLNYGHEAIGMIEVTENGGKPDIKLSMNGEPKKHEMQDSPTHTITETEEALQTSEEPKTTGMMTGETVKQTDILSYVAVITSIITLVMVGLIYSNSRKRTI
ncbi:MAG: hypothetical protein JW754_00870 [Candidatus Aenigmarchaeota archaeon]|nr:hypothetical protein [Candidatus Aenigmarchaeota archaeon]